jgi:cell division ATPase FtsA
LDKKKIKNVPIGLFGDFYSHELSFTLINSNDYKNLKNIFDKCNLKIKKILIKSFIKGANISDTYKYTDTFFQIRINENNSKIFYFENDTLKFEQNFKFGTSIIAKDISKITTLKLDTIRKILDNVELKENLPEDELIEEEYFNDNNYRKIKKKLVYEIALARIKEISELILFKNINLKHYNKTTKDIFLEIDQNFKFKCLVDIYKTVFSMNDNFKVNFQDILLNKNLLYTANKVVHFGWKKEAIPISNSQKSLIARFFDAIFG